MQKIANFHEGDVRDAEHLAGAAEIAEVLGVDANTINQWKRRPHLGFPEPVVHLSCGAVWDMREIIAWADYTGRKVVQRDYRAPKASSASSITEGSTTDG